MIRFLFLFVAAFTLSACGIGKTQTVVDPVSIYKEGLQQGRKEIVRRVEGDLGRKGVYGHVKPYNPIRLPADIRKVWVVNHPNGSGDLVSGHWVFLVVRKEKWAAPSLPPISAEAAMERMPLNIPLVEGTSPARSPAAKPGK